MRIWVNLSNWLKRNTSNKQGRFYSELDLFPLDRWEKCQSGDLRYINEDAKPTEQDAERWVMMYNRYLEKFGIDDQLEKYLQVKEHLIRLRCAYIENPDDMLLNQIEIEQINLKALDPSKYEGMTIDECLVYLAKMQGVAVIRKRDLTIIEFKNLMSVYSKNK